MKVLVAIDDFACSQAAIEYIANRPWWGDTEFLIFNVIVIPTANDFPVWGFAVDSEWREDLAIEAEKMVANKVIGLRRKLGPKIKIECDVVQGAACESIVQKASDWDADLIIMGSHGRTGLNKFLVGSVAEGVLLKAPCSIEIVKPRLPLEEAELKTKKSNSKKSVASGRGF